MWLHLGMGCFGIRRCSLDKKLIANVIFELQSWSIMINSRQMIANNFTLQKKYIIEVLLNYVLRMNPEPFLQGIVLKVHCFINSY